MGFCWRSLVTFCCYWQKVTRRRQDKKEKLLGRVIHWSQKKKGAPACASALDAALLLERQKLCIAVKSTEVHQNSALPTVRGCSSTSRMLLTPVRYITIRSKPRPKPACLQEP